VKAPHWCQSAAVLQTVQAKLVAQRVQQWHVGIVYLQDVRLAVDGQIVAGGHGPIVSSDGLSNTTRNLIATPRAMTD
jgi:hypothetical protein